MDDHTDLLYLLKSTDIDFVMSNAKVNLVTSIFKDYKIEDIIARRSIHSKDPSSYTTEVLISNIYQKVNIKMDLLVIAI